MCRREGAERRTVVLPSHWPHGALERKKVLISRERRNLTARLATAYAKPLFTFKASVEALETHGNN